MNDGLLRIIAGEWRSRKLSFPQRENIRPTPDRIRETLFNWLHDTIANSKCLDLFSGSGALGFEALSRGARSVVMVDNDPEVVSSLKKNTIILKTSKVNILCLDGMKYLKTTASDESFNIVFLDPPYQAGILDECSSLLENSNCLENDALIYIEHSAANPDIITPENWECHRKKSSGEVSYALYKRRVI